MFKLVKFYEWKSKSHVPFKRIGVGGSPIIHVVEESPWEAYGRSSPLSTL